MSRTRQTAFLQGTLGYPGPIPTINGVRIVNHSTGFTVATVASRGAYDLAGCTRIELATSSLTGKYAHRYTSTPQEAKPGASAPRSTPTGILVGPRHMAPLAGIEPALYASKAHVLSVGR